MIWFICGFDYVRCERDFTHVSTLPPEYRPVVLRPKNQRQGIEGGGGLPPPLEARRQLPPWRQFTETQQTVIEAYMQGSYYMDVTTGYSLRCQELTFVDMLELYTKWFTFHALPSNEPYTINERLCESPWTDGARRLTKLRLSYVEEAVGFIRHKMDIVEREHDRIAISHLYDQIFQPILQEYYNHDGYTYSELFMRFVDITKKKRNVVVFTQVTPENFPRFLIHIVLSRGRFSPDCATEMDAYGRPNMKEAFRAVHLLSPGLPTEDDVIRMSRDHVLDQLQFMSIGTKRPCTLIQTTIDGYKRFLLTHDVVHDGVPLALERQMVDKGTEDVERLLDTRRNNLVDALELENIPDFPNAQDLRTQQVVNYNPNLQRTQNQSHESFIQQNITLRLCIESIDSMLLAFITFQQSVLIVGSPGSGKTHILLTALTYALARRLQCQLVALTSERARRLGGEHLHLFFGIPAQTSRCSTMRALAEITLFRLAKNPVRLAGLQRLDVLFIEEVGLISAQLFAVMDIVLRHVRDSSAPFG